MSNLKLIQLNGSKEKVEKEGKVKVMKIENPLGIIVRKDGTAEEIFIDKKLDIDNIDWKPFKQYIKTKGRGDIERECDWEMPDGMLVSMFGWTKGKEENINKLEVPPPVDMELYYGDLIFIATIKGFPICFNIEKFEEFYSEAFGGFEDIEDSDEEANDEYDEEDDEGDNDSFIVEDHDSEPEDSEESEEEAGESETESEENEQSENEQSENEQSENEQSENEQSENEQREEEVGETESDDSEFEYRSLMEEEQNSDEVKILENEIEKITEEQIIENCLGELFVGFANNELCILSRIEEEERYGEEIELNGNKIVLVPFEDD